MTDKYAVEIPKSDIRCRWIGGVHIDFRRDGPKYSPVNHDVVFIRYGKLANKDENACIYERPTDASLARLMASLRKLAPALEAS